MMGILLLAYYYSHYMMASAIAHISAMYTIFVSIAIAAALLLSCSAVILSRWQLGGKLAS